MRNILVAVMGMVAIIVVRIVLSCAFTEQVAEVFARVSVAALFFYFVIKAGKIRTI